MVEGQILGLSLKTDSLGFLMLLSSFGRKIAVWPAAAMGSTYGCACAPVG